MKKLLATIKNYPEVTGYVILAILLFGACFFAEFGWLAAILVVALALYFRNEVKVLGLILFVSCFYTAFRLIGIRLAIDAYVYEFRLQELLLDVLRFYVILLYLFRVIKKEKKLNLKILIPLALYFVYLILPFHECKIRDWFSAILFYLSLYVVFEERKEIDFKHLARVFVFGIILSAVYSLYRDFSTLLTYHMHIFLTENGKPRFQGLTSHSLQLAAFVVLAIASLFVLKYKNKISLGVFYLVFIPLFIIGYFTFSRAYLLTVAAALVIFSILYMFKYKKKSWLFILSVVLIVGLVAVIFFDQTKTFFVRFTTPEPIWDEEFLEPIKDSLYNGDIYLGSGRKDLFKFYTTHWASSVQSILFGVGISRPLITGLDSHNIFLQELWEHGLVGYVFYLIILINSVDWKKFKEVKKYLSALIIIVPFLMFMSLELIDYDFVGLVLILTVIGWLAHITDEQQNNLPINAVNPELLKDIKLSIIIPVYNGEKFLKSCIDKVLQISLNKEIIVINDGSNDNSFEMLQAYGDQIALINLEENKGVSHARNLGLHHATGDYISFIDIDDDFELDMHGKILTKMIQENADVGMCQYDDINLEGVKQERTGREFEFCDLQQTDVVKLCLLNKLNNTIWSTIYKTDLAKGTQFETEIKVGEDRLYQLKILLKAEKTVFLNEDLYHYVHNPYSVTRTNDFLNKAIDHTKLADYLTIEERTELNQNFKEAFEYYQANLFVVPFHMVLRWRSHLKKAEIKETKKRLKEFINRDICNKIIKNRYAPVYNKIECLLIKFFGLNFYLFCFPFYHFVWKRLRKLKRFFKKNFI